MRLKRWAFVVLAGWWVVSPSLLMGGPEKTTTVVMAEGTGKDEKEARAAAFREAVSKAVGTLVESETVVLNDRIVKDRVAEFSGGYVRTFDTLAVDRIEGGRVRVKIRATVERLRLVDRPAEAKVPVKDVRGDDLVAEKQTKEEARTAATELLGKLYAELLKVAAAEVRGKPRLSADGRGLVVNLAVKADEAAYSAFAKRATTVLDRLAIAKDSAVAVATKVPGEPARYAYRAAGGIGPRDVFTKPDLGPRTPPGYAVWLATPTGSPDRLRWSLYWVDADVTKAVAATAGSPRVRLRLEDQHGEVITEESVDLSRASFGLGGLLRPWFLGHVSPRSFQTDGVTRHTASVFLAPLWSTLNSDAHWPEYQLSVPVTHTFLLSDRDLERVRKVTAAVEFDRRPADRR